MRVLATLALAFSLLGWSAWTVICNVYEFAPRLPVLPLALAWLLGLAAAWPASRAGAQGSSWPRAVWALAGLNAGWVAAAHQGLDAVATPLFMAAASGVVGFSAISSRRHARAAARVASTTH